DASGTGEDPASRESAEFWLDLEPDRLAERRQSAVLVVGAVWPELPGALHVGLYAQLPGFHGCGCVGQYAPGDVGVGHREFRLVDRYRPCGDVDFSNSFSVTAALAHGSESGG